MIPSCTESRTFSQKTASNFSTKNILSQQLVMSAKNSGDFLLLKVDSLETAMSLATEKYTELAASAPLRGNGNQSNLFFDGKG